MIAWYYVIAMIVGFALGVCLRSLFDWRYSRNKLAVSFKYNELLMAVQSKYPNESRYETALRYIKSCEHNIGSNVI